MADSVSERLADAETKYHQLLTGVLPRVVVDQGGDRVEYTATNISRLGRYIESLKSQLNQNTRGPLRVWIG